MLVTPLGPFHAGHHFPHGAVENADGFRADAPGFEGSGLPDEALGEQIAQAMFLAAIRGDARAMLVEHGDEALKQLPTGKLLLGDGFGASLGHALIQRGTNILYK